MDKILETIPSIHRSWPDSFSSEDAYVQNFILTPGEEVSPIHKAILDGRIDLLELNLVNLLNKNGESPLLAALRLRDRQMALDIVRFLKTGYPDVTLSDVDGTSPIHEIARCECDDDITLAILWELLEMGCDVIAENNLGETPLHVARLLRVAEVLVEQGADINARDGCGNTVLQAQVANLQILQMLVTRGVLLDSRNIRGCTAIHKCVYQNTRESLNVLLEKGANVNLGSESPLELTAWFGVDNTIRDILLDKSSLLNVLRFASYGDCKILKVLEHWEWRAFDVATHAMIVMDVVKSIPLKPSKRLRKDMCAILVMQYFLRNASRITPGYVPIILRRFERTFNYTMINVYLKTCDFTTITQQDLKKTLDVFQKAGETLDYLDLEVVYHQFGDSDLLHQLLTRKVVDKRRKVHRLPLFLRFLCDVTADLTYTLRNSPKLVNIEVSCVDIYNLGRYCRLPLVLVKRLQDMKCLMSRLTWPRFLDFIVFEDLKTIERNCGVKSLVELSRNQCRLFLSEKYKTSKTSDLSVVLSKTDIPVTIREIVMLKRPLYFNIRGPPYKSFSKVIYSNIYK